MHFSSHPPGAGYGAAFQELMALIESGTIASVSVCLRLPDGTTHEIPFGDSDEERACILERLHAQLRAALH